MIEASNARNRPIPLCRSPWPWLLCTVVAACGTNVEDGRSKGSFDVPDGTSRVRVTLEKGSISVLPSDIEGRIEWEAAFRKGTTDPADLLLLAAIPGELHLVESGEAGEVRLSGPRVPTALAERDDGAVIALKLVVRVPRDLGVIVRTERGPIGVADRDGPVEIHTGAGDLLVERVRGDVVAFSGGGSHTVIDHSGALDASTQHGNFLVFVDDLAPGGIKLHTESGSIQCNLPPGSGFELNASSRRGEVESPFEIPKDTLKNGQRQVGTVGAGGPDVQVSSRLGSVSVRHAARDRASGG